VTVGAEWMRKDKEKRKMKQAAKLPMDYDVYIFDLYGTLVDIHTKENDDFLWEKLALFMGYYKAGYKAEELRLAYRSLVQSKEEKIKDILESEMQYTHEAYPEIDIAEVFYELYEKVGVKANEALTVHTGQFFRALATEYVRLYEGTKEILAALKKQGKKIYLLSNAQRIFTAYEMQYLGIDEYFDAIFISSDYEMKKPDERFFRILLDEHEIDVRKALFIGNDSRCDIEGAANVGIDTFYVHSAISPKNDSAPNATYTVEDFLSWDIEGIM